MSRRKQAHIFKYCVNSHGLSKLYKYPAPVITHRIPIISTFSDDYDEIIIGTGLQIRLSITGHGVVSDSFFLTEGIFEKVQRRWETILITVLKISKWPVPAFPNNAERCQKFGLDIETSHWLNLKSISESDHRCINSTRDTVIVPSPRHLRRKRPKIVWNNISTPLQSWGNLKRALSSVRLSFLHIIHPQYWMASRDSTKLTG